MAIKTITQVSVVLILSSLLYCISSSAQENILKIDVFNSTLGNYSISYEHTLNTRQAINLNLSLMPHRDIFKIGAGAFDLNSGLASEDRVSGFSLSPEYRFYFGKNKSNLHKGFYIAPYVRASDYKLLLHDIYENHNTEIDCDLFTTGIGVQLGAHWIFSNVFSLDFQFFGAGVDRHNLKLDYSTKEQGVDFFGYGSSVKESNSEIALFGSKFETEYGADYIKSNATTIMPGARGRLTLGFAF